MRVWPLFLGGHLGSDNHDATARMAKGQKGGHVFSCQSLPHFGREAGAIISKSKTSKLEILWWHLHCTKPSRSSFQLNPTLCEK